MQNLTKTFIVYILFPTMTAESKQPTDETLLGTDLEQNVRRLYSEVVNTLNKSRVFLEALAENFWNSSSSEGYLQLRQPIKIEGSDFSYSISFGKGINSYLIITGEKPSEDKNLCSTLFLEFPEYKLGESTLQYATHTEGKMEEREVFTNTQTAVQKAENFLATLKKDLS